MADGLPPQNGKLRMVSIQAGKHEWDILDFREK
jgi:hypothetical protein